MPSTQIDVRRQRSPEQEVALIRAVHQALQDGFRIPADDQCVRLVVHEPHRFLCPPDRSQPENYTVIHIDAFSGRSLDAKRALYRAMVERLEPLGIPRDHVKVVLREIPRENWGLRGQAGCDVELGFKVEV